MKLASSPSARSCSMVADMAPPWLRHRSGVEPLGESGPAPSGVRGKTSYPEAHEYRDPLSCGVAARDRKPKSTKGQFSMTLVYLGEASPEGLPAPRPPPARSPATNRLAFLPTGPPS